MRKFFPGCKTEKDTVEFNKAARRDGCRSYCKQCEHEKSKAYITELRTQIYDKLGHRCRKCGFDDKRALQIDHIHGGGNQEHKEIRNTVGFLKKVLADIENQYQILCANCNWIKRMESREHPKGNKISPEALLRMSEAGKVRKLTEVSYLRLKASHKGQVPWNKKSVEPDVLTGQPNQTGVGLGGNAI